MKNMKRSKLKCSLLASSIIFSSAFSLHAENSSLQEAIVGGKASINFRLRSEFVDEDAKSATAITERLRIGYTTGDFHGFSAHLDAEDIRALDDSYNAAGLNGKGSKSVVADPEDTEINQAFINYMGDGFHIKMGRQRIILDDARFIGNVGWRQNEQTYDAALLTASPVENLNLKLGYIGEVNRIFGPDSGRDFDSQSFLVHTNYKFNPSITITGFGYLLDFENSTANSTDTFGIRANGALTITEDYNFKYEISAAIQSEAGDSSLDYDAEYYNANFSLSRKGIGIGVGYEVLGSDSGVGFKTPLATAHKFNGWADKFLSTPANGLEDFYLYGFATLPAAIKAKVFYHIFNAETGSDEYGKELDIVLSKAVNKNWSFTSKFADFSDDSSTNLGDITKLTIQTDYKF
jgi:hypothetical protein